VWAGLYQEQGELLPRLAERLAGMDLALVFTPKPRPAFLARLLQGGVVQAVWIPSFPPDGTDHVVTVQTRRLEELGLGAAPAPVRLHLEPESGRDTGFEPGDRILAIAPGSGQPAKNWPLPRYYEVARDLAWEAGLKVVWLAGPAEEPLLPYIQGLAAAQEQVVWNQEPLERVALLLARTQVYLGPHPGLSGGRQRPYPPGGRGRGSPRGGSVRPHRPPGVGPLGGAGHGSDPTRGSRTPPFPGRTAQRPCPGGGAAVLVK